MHIVCVIVNIIDSLFIRLKEKKTAALKGGRGEAGISYM